MRALRDKFELTKDNTREQVRANYRQILERRKFSSINLRV